jgi:hypothetical protein
MLNLLVLLVGLASGAGGATAWLLSEPDSAAQQPSLDLQERRQTLQERMQRAIKDGERAGKETEDRLRRQFDSYRARPAQR